ncbi:MAG: arginine deiminase-related protein [Flavobacteriales bacterium]
MKRQITSSIMMIRPVAFRFNEQTAVNNYYQQVLEGVTADQVQAQAQNEFDTFVDKLRAKGVEVVVIEDTLEPNTPDSIFPNNWISFHQDGRVGLYPMCAENRRLERREDVLTILIEQHNFVINEVLDFSHYESNDLFLEGTGSMLLDRVNKIVYAALSLRTDAKILEDFCEKFDYKAVTFTSNQTVGTERLAIYHTNVMMCLGESFAVLCADTVDDETERKALIVSLENTGKEVIYITEAQKHRFAGNMLQVQSKAGEKYLVMSASAHQSLNPEQVEQIEKHCQILSSSLDTIEACGGGSARCMMAEIFLPKNA